jgi:FAD:protein FMN transferase
MGVEFKFSAMGSPCRFYFDGLGSSKALDNSIQLALTEIKRLEAKYSRYKMDSQLSIINRSQNLWCDIDDETSALLDYAQTCYDLSDGLFDITSGVFRQIWDFKNTDLVLPSEPQIKSLLKRVGFSKLKRQQNRVFMPNDMELDLGGLVKEYAVDAVASLFLARQLNNCLIDLGGDIRVIGSKSNGEPWAMGISDPDSPQKAIATVKLNNHALTTSGDYQRYAMINGKRYCHIINAKTGWPVGINNRESNRSVSVIAPQCIIAGSMTSIAMLMEENAQPWLNDSSLSWLLINASGEIKNNNLM